MKDTTTPLIAGLYYHIYNRGNNREDLFRESRNYRYFLELYARHVHALVDTFAYCLMPNHFHLLVRIKENTTEAKLAPKSAEIPEHTRTKPKIVPPSRYFSNLFNAYTKAINKAYGRTGSLFEERFGRIAITDKRHLVHLIFYIHFNPQRHLFVRSFRDWPWSSYHALQTTGETKLCRRAVLDWFGNAAQLEAFHRGMVEETTIAALIDEDLA